MPEMVIRPSMKPIIARYIFAAVIAAVGAVCWNLYVTQLPGWGAAVLLLLFIWPIDHHLRRQLSKVTVAGDKLRYETGLMTKSTRIIELAKVQDVRSDQSLSQRMWGIGDLSIETAGESSRLTVRNIDRPGERAEWILNAAHHQGEQKSV